MTVAVMLRWKLPIGWNPLIVNVSMLRRECIALDEKRTLTNQTLAHLHPLPRQA